MTVNRSNILTTPDLLWEYYAARQLDPPLMHAITPDQMPQPYRDLLVHERDMTTTLENHWREALHIHVLEQSLDVETMNRLVVLQTQTDHVPVEFGAIRIHLTPFGGVARDEIVQCRRPLGAILREHHATYTCRPSAYFAIDADDLTQPVFAVNGRTTLFGRHNTLFDGNDALLAEVVEILPPMSTQPQ